MRKPKTSLDAPRSGSLWPAREITPETDAQTITKSIPDYIERSREGLLCVESRCDRARKKGASVKLDNIARQIRALLPTLEEWRKEVDGLIYESKADDLF